MAKLLEIVGWGWFRRFPIKVEYGKVIMDALDFHDAVELVQTPFVMDIKLVEETKDIKPERYRC